MLYQEKLHEAELLYSKEQLAEQKTQLENKYRDPALQLIQSGASASEDPEYVKALIAFLEKRYDEALKQAQIAEQNTSWLYEGKLLQGQIFSALGNEQRLMGKTDIAGNYYQQATASYLEAAKKGQSDPQVYEGLCAVQSAAQIMHLDQKGSSPENFVKEGVGYCEKALQADSRNINANLFSASIYTQLAYAQYLHGIDCTAATERAADFARAILQIEPENGLGHQALGIAYKTLATEQLDWGKDPTHAVNLASTSLEKASTRMPGNAELFSNLGTNYVTQSQYESNTGKDPFASINKAIDRLNKAVELSPQNFRYRNNLGIAYSWKGVFEKASGLDPQRSYKYSIVHSKKSMELNPSYVNAYIWTGLTSLRMATAQIESGENPVPAIDESILMRKKALTLDPQNAYAHTGIGACYIIKANWLLDQNKDATAELQSGRESYEKSLKSNDKALMAYKGSAEIEYLAARNAIAQKESPEAYLKKADQILRSGMALSPNYWGYWQVLSMLHLTRAEYLFSLGRSTEMEIASGIKAADRALSNNPKSEETHGVRGKLYLLRARTLSGVPRQNEAKEAVLSFDHAFRLKSALRKQYGSDREEANRLAH
jgi:hypothetical protein